MKKFILSASVLVTFFIYALILRGRGEGETPQAIVANTSAPVSQVPLSTPIASGSSPPAPTPPPVPTPQTGRYKDGTYTGSVADAFYGNIQVQAVISDGRITAVNFLQYPNDRSTSVMINSQADPMLAQEAIQIQSAQVSGVSGATASSGAFVQSLQDALQQAM